MQSLQNAVQTIGISASRENKRESIHHKPTQNHAIPPISQVIKPALSDEIDMLKARFEKAKKLNPNIIPGAMDDTMTDVFTLEWKVNKNDYVISPTSLDDLEQLRKEIEKFGLTLLPNL